MGASLAEVIRARRIVRGMERQDLAAAVGCDVRTVRRWESGSRPLTRHMPALREVLEIPIEEMDRIMLRLIRNRDGGLRIEGPEFLEARGLSHRWLAETLLDMDRRLIGTDPILGVHDPERWESIFEALPDSWRMLVQDERVVGYWHFAPLEPALYDRLGSGCLAEARLRMDHLASLDLPGNLDVNVTSLVIEPSFRQGQGIPMLIRSFCDRLCDLAGRGVRFGRIGAIAWTPQSNLLCRRLGMHPVRTVGNERAIFFEANVLDLTDPLGLSEYDALKTLLKVEHPAAENERTPHGVRVAREAVNAKMEEVRE